MRGLLGVKGRSRDRGRRLPDYPAEQTCGDPVELSANWIQTVPGKGWFTLLRLYGALEPWFDKNWRPSEIEVVQ